MQIFKAADIIGGQLRFCSDPSYGSWVHMASSEIVRILTCLDGVENPRPHFAWTAELPIENRPSPLKIQLPPLISVSDPVEEPVFLPNPQFIFYNSQLFVAEDAPQNATERVEIVSAIKNRGFKPPPKPDQIKRPKGIPETHLPLWVHQDLATDMWDFCGSPWVIAGEGESAFPKQDNEADAVNAHDTQSRPAAVPKTHVKLWAHPRLARDLAEFYGKEGHIITDPAAPEHVSGELPLPKALTALSTVRQDIGSFLDELDKLTGLAAVKREVRSLINYLRLQQLRKKEGLPTGQMTMHLVFTGNPGTGKTTVARLLAKIYKAMGFLPQSQFVETDRGGLVGEYLGHTAQKTSSVVQKALGGVLFIDEAYSLSRTSGGQKDMFGLGAIDTLLKAMEDNRDKLVVIVAGYPEEMKEFISSNPGLRSRFTRYIDFPDYSPAELMQIFQQQASDAGYVLSESAHRRDVAIFEDGYENRGAGFGNGRWVRTVFERASLNLSDRIAEGANITRTHLTTLEESDIENVPA